MDFIGLKKIIHHEGTKNTKGDKGVPNDFVVPCFLVVKASLKFYRIISPPGRSRLVSHHQAKAAMIARANSPVLAVPPMSFVRTLPSMKTFSIASSIFCAASRSPM